MRYLSRLGIKLGASSVQTFDGRSAIRWEGVFSCAPALLEPAVLKVRKPSAGTSAGKRHARSERYAFNRRDVLWRRASRRQSKQNQLPHGVSLLFALMSAMGRKRTLRQWRLWVESIVAPDCGAIAHLRSAAWLDQRFQRQHQACREHREKRDPREPLQAFPRREQVEMLFHGAHPNPRALTLWLARNHFPTRTYLVHGERLIS